MKSPRQTTIRKLDLLESKGHKPRRGKVFTCPCGNIFYRSPCRSSGARVCSQACTKYLLMTNKPLKCIMCKKEFYCSKSQEKYRNRKTCSKKCQGELQHARAKIRHFTGKDEYRFRRWLRGNIRAKEWRKAVFERDDYTCQFCKTRGGYLQADHIKPFAYFPDLRFELSNGRTLCKPCHLKTDTFGERAKKLYGVR